MSTFRNSPNRSLQITKATRRPARAVARAAMKVTESLESRVLFAAIPSPYLQADIGTVPTTGTGSYNTGTFTVNGSGADIFGTADAFHYVYAPLTGDGTFVARYNGVVSGGSSTATGGIDLRTGLDPGAANLYLGVQSTGNDFVNVRYADAGGDTTNIVSPSVAAPSGTYLKLVRSGNTVTAYTSPDGTTYTLVGSANFPSLPSTVDVGLAVTSGTDSALATLTADNLAVTNVSAPSATVTTNPGTITAPVNAINFAVTYAAASGNINTATLADGNLTVTGPNGISEAATFDGVTGSGSSVVASYSIPSEVANGTYTITQNPNQVFDDSGNPVDPADLATFSINIPDVTAPVAALTSNPTTVAGGSTPYTFNVTYTDENQVSAASIGNNNVLVTGPGGYSQAGTLTTTGLLDDNVIVASYTVPAPTAAGTYTVTQNATVTDTAGNAVAAGTLGTFSATTDSGVPTVSLTSAPTVTVATTTPYQFTVTYHDDNAINASTVGNGNLTVTGSGYSQAATLVSTGLVNGATVVATYSVPAFTFNGTYTIAMNASQVEDLSGNPIAAGTVGTFGVNVSSAPTAGLITGKVITPNGAGLAGQTVFLDTNNDGVLESGETSAITDSSGDYSLGGLATGTVHVAEVPTSTFTVFQPTGGTQAVAAVEGTTVANVNFVNTPVVTAGAADLVGAITNAVPGAVVGGAKGTLKVKITNTGTGVAKGKPSITLYASTDGTLTNASVITTVSAGSINLKTNKTKTTTIKFDYPSTLPTGSYTIIAAIDSTNVIPESNEANNFASSATPVTIAAPQKDLTGVFKKISPTTVTASKKTTANITIANSGNVPASGAMTVSFYESTDTIFDGGDTLIGSVAKKINIKNGKAQSIPFAFKPINSTAGSNYLIAVINSTGSIVESNTANNTVVSATPLTFA